MRNTSSVPNEGIVDRCETVCLVAARADVRSARKLSPESLAPKAFTTDERSRSGDIDQ